MAWRHARIRPRWCKGGCRGGPRRLRHDGVPEAVGGLGGCSGHGGAATVAGGRSRCGLGQVQRAGAPFLQAEVGLVDQTQVTHFPWRTQRQ